jgi:hypothetical protein
MAKILVNTTNGAEIPADHVQISSNLRETEKMVKEGKSVPADQRYRNAIIKALEVPSIEERFRPLVLDTLYTVAKSRFEKWMEETNRSAKEIESEDYTVDSLLAWYATDAVSGRMTKEQVVAWFKAGDTYKLVNEKKGEKQAASWLELFGKMASPNHGVNPNTCRVLLAGMQPLDAASEIGKAIAVKLGNTIAKSETSQVEGL